jgi:hypothetical protein
VSISHPHASIATIHENGDIVPADQGLIDGLRSGTVTDPHYMAEFIDLTAIREWAAIIESTFPDV